MPLRYQEQVTSPAPLYLAPSPTYQPATLQVFRVVPAPDDPYRRT